MSSLIERLWFLRLQKDDRTYIGTAAFKYNILWSATNIYRWFETLDQKAAVVYIPEFDISLRMTLPEGLAVYTAEMIAIILALQWIETVEYSV